MRLDAGAVLGLLDDYPTRSGYVITPVVVWGGGDRARPVRRGAGGVPHRPPRAARRLPRFVAIQETPPRWCRCRSAATSSTPRREPCCCSSGGSPSTVARPASTASSSRCSPGAAASGRPRASSAAGVAEPAAAILAVERSTTSPGHLLDALHDELGDAVAAVTL